MIFISHRGNVYGPDPKKENSPTHIKNAIDLGFDVEIDLLYLDNSFWLGHDIMLYQIDYKFLIKYKKRLWCHAKSAMALKELLDLNMHCFFHDRDDMTLTSKNYIWVYPTYKYLNGYCIIVHPEIYGIDFRYAAGVCSDYVDNIFKGL